MYEIFFLKALFWTLSIELLIGLSLKKYGGENLGINKISFGRLAIFILLASMLTLPYIWFIMPVFIKTRTAYVIASETLAFIAEGLWYWFNFKISMKKALLFSLILNGGSFLFGILIIR